MTQEGRRDLRNIGILAHIDAGKTSLTERILYVSGRIRCPGEIDAGTTVTDFLAIERERGITVKAAAAHLSWGSATLNLIDTPGHVDFGSEVDRSLRALDGVLVLLCAVAGVQSRTEALYKACLRRGAPRLAFVNKMDRRGASFRRAAEDLRRILDPGAVAVQIPWGEGESFRGVVDLVGMVAYDFGAAAGGGVGGGASGSESLVGSESAIGFESTGAPGKLPHPLPIPAVLEREAREARSALVAAIAEALSERAALEGDRQRQGRLSGQAKPYPDDASSALGESLMEDYVAGREIEASRLSTAIRVATIAGAATPLLCGSAFCDPSAVLLLNAVVDWLPAPGEAGAPEATDPSTGESVEPRGSDSFSGLVFKTGSDPHFGRISWTRIWSGFISPGDRILDARAGKLARVAKLFRIHADSIEAVERASAGDIVAVALASIGASGGGGTVEGGLGATGASLCDARRPLLYEPISFGEPVVSIAIEPRSRQEGEALRAGIAALVEEDPSLRWREDPQTGRAELSGMGELHLEVAIDRLARDFGAHPRAGKPRVAYRESLAGEARAREDFDRDLGGERARASVELKLSPGQEGAGLSFRSELSARVAPSLLEAARRGAEAALSVGPSAGFPMDGVEVALLEIAVPAGSGVGDRVVERAVEIAASLAGTRAAREAGSRVVEPCMRLEVSVPEDFLGAAAAAISGRGGRIESVEEAPGGGRLIAGAAPLRRLFGFSGELRSASEGRAECSTRFFRYEPCPKGFSDFA